MTKLNADPRHNPKTTYLGFAFVAVGLFFYMGDYIVDFKKDVNHWVNIPLLGLGALLVVAPDKWVNIVSTAFRLFFKKIFRS